MKRLIPIYAILTVIAVLAGVSCNSSSSSDEPYVIPTSTLVKSFSLEKDDSILVNLDSVFFSIDTNRRLIYNADSLPKGTDITKMIAKITLTDYASAEISVNGASVRPDTTFTYKDNEKDTIDFTGIVVLKVKAADGESTNDYRVRVNVHKMEPDSLYWNEMAKKELPGRTNSVESQKSTQLGNKIFTLIKESGSYTLASTDNIAAYQWNKEVVNFDFTPAQESFNATDKVLTIIGESAGVRNIYYSTDEGKTWIKDNTTATSIIGGYGDKILFVDNNNGYKLVTKTPGESDFTYQEAEEDFPITCTSQCVKVVNKWSDTPTVVFIGGKTKTGKIVGDAWGFDGTNFGKVSNGGIIPLANVTLLGYYNYFNNNKYSKKKYPVMLAMGGIDAMNKPANIVYISYDNGVNWKVGDEYLQLPDYIKPFHSAQAFVIDETRTRAANGWVAMPSKKLPAWWQIGAPATRAAQEITSWDAPYIYLFGGININGGTYDTVWKGVINRLSFKPIV